MSDKPLHFEDALNLTLDAIKEYYGEAELQNIYGSTPCVPVQTPYNRTNENGEYIIGLKIDKFKYDQFIERDNIRVTKGLPKFYENKILFDGTDYWWIGQYYLKRLSESSSSAAPEAATASGSKVGPITSKNYNTKLNNGEITSKFNINNTEDHHEPGSTTIMCRDALGRAVVENGPDDYHVANNKKVKEIVSTGVKKAINFDSNGSYLVAGWYRIAEADFKYAASAEGSMSTVLHIDTTIKGGYNVADAIFSIQSVEYDSVPVFNVIGFQCRNDRKNVMPKCRVVYYNGKTTQKSNTSKSIAQKRYLDIYIKPDETNRIAILMNVQQLFQGSKGWIFVPNLNDAWLFSNNDADGTYNENSLALGMNPDEWQKIQNDYIIDTSKLTQRSVTFADDMMKNYVNKAIDQAIPKDTSEWYYKQNLPISVSRVDDGPVNVEIKLQRSDYSGRDRVFVEMFCDNGDGIEEYHNIEFFAYHMNGSGINQLQKFGQVNVVAHDDDNFSLIFNDSHLHAGTIYNFTLYSSTGWLSLGEYDVEILPEEY